MTRRTIVAPARLACAFILAVAGALAASPAAVAQTASASWQSAPAARYPDGAQVPFTWIIDDGANFQTGDAVTIDLTDATGNDIWDDINILGVDQLCNGQTPALGPGTYALEIEVDLSSGFVALSASFTVSEESARWDAPPASASAAGADVAFSWTVADRGAGGGGDTSRITVTDAAGGIAFATGDLVTGDGGAGTTYHADVPTLAPGAYTLEVDVALSDGTPVALTAPVLVEPRASGTGGGGCAFAGAGLEAAPGTLIGYAALVLGLVLVRRRARASRYGACISATSSGSASSSSSIVR